MKAIPSVLNDFPCRRTWKGVLPVFVVAAMLFLCGFCNGTADAADRAGARGGKGTSAGRVREGDMRGGGFEKHAGTFIRKLKHTPFPYGGKVEDGRANFFDFTDPDTGERYHTSRQGERLPEKEHYRDNSVLFHVPPGFSPERPFRYVVFFHGINSGIRESVKEFELVEQIDGSGSNVILLMPQLAVNAPDSSPGKFMTRDRFRKFMDEAAGVLAARMGKKYYKKFAAAPIILTPFSGGYKTAAYVLERGGVNSRLRGILLLDAFYDDVDRYDRWLVKNHGNRFFVSLYTEGSCRENTMALARRLRGHKIRYAEEWPSSASLKQGGIGLIKSDIEHMKVPLLGPPERPLKTLLQDLDGLARKP